MSDVKTFMGRSSKNFKNKKPLFGNNNGNSSMDTKTAIKTVKSLLSPGMSKKKVNKLKVKMK